MALALVLVACGGGGGSGSKGVAVGFPASPATLADSNVAAVAVESGPGNNINIPYVTVTVCTPGTRTCASIDHVLLDTGSSGLRLFASQVSPLVTLPPQSVGASSSISECAHFLNTLAWGTVRLADVEIAGERAPSLPIQLMDVNYAPVPATCGGAPLLSAASDAPASPPVANTELLSANGILGVGLFANDRQVYFGCTPPVDGCELTRSSYPSASQQVQNPVSLFTSVNRNGVVIQLPALAATGAMRAQGFLIFGVGTQANNQLGAANVVQMNPTGAFFTTTYKGRSYSQGIFDSGSNGIYFDDASIPLCSPGYTDFYCPSAMLNQNAMLPLLGGAQAPVAFQVANAINLFGAPQSSSSYAYNNLSAPIEAPVNALAPSPIFDWGLPFYFGRSVFTLIEGRAVGGGSSLSGPFSAFTNN